MSYTGWMIPDSERDRLLAMFPPQYEVVKATHVTLTVDDETIPVDAEIEIVGYVDDGQGVEAMVVSVDGTTQRPDGKVYHCTWSRAEHRASKDSNDVIACGWIATDTPVPIRTRAFMSRGNRYVTTPLSGR